MNDMRPEVITIKDVARVAGVSISTASRALGDGSASRATRDKVRKAARDLGFVPNMAARRLSSGKTNTVAIMVAERPDFIFTDTFLSMLVSQLAVSLSTKGLLGFLLLADPSDPDDFSMLVHRTGVDGVIVASFHKSMQLEESIRSLRVPVMFVGRPSQELVDYPYVDVDNIRGGCDAADRLASLGRNRIVEIAGPRGMSSVEDRDSGFTSQLARRGLTVLDRTYGPFTSDSGRKSMESILARTPHVDAVFAHSDGIAAGVMLELAHKGLSVPDDVAIVGFDDSALAKITNPPLTTLRQPVGDMAQAAASMMGEILGERRAVVTKQLFHAPLVVRGTA